LVLGYAKYVNKVLAFLKIDRERIDWGRYATWHPY